MFECDLEDVTTLEFLYLDEGVQPFSVGGSVMNMYF